MNLWESRAGYEFIHVIDTRLKEMNKELKRIADTLEKINTITDAK